MVEFGAAQAIGGLVYDSETHEPLMGVSVYFDGSSFGVITDEAGKFRLEPKFQSNASLVFSYLGYVTRKVEYFNLNENIKIALSIDVFEVPEVIVTSDPFSRKQKLEVFKKEFIGDSYAAEETEILNEEVIELYFNSTDNTLSAYAKEPLKIQNNYLGYRINFDLEEFKVSFRTKSLKRIDNIFTTVFRGYSFFQDLGVVDDRLLERREKKYMGSIMHFMRTLWNQDWHEQKFKVKIGYKTVVPSEVITVSAGADLVNKNVVFAEKKLGLVYKNTFNYKSSLTLLGGPLFVIDKYGNYHPHRQVLIGGYLSSHRISDLLPLEYEGISYLE